MTKPLKTLSINFRFKNPSVVYEPNLSTDKALFDYDLVVVRPYSYHSSGPGGHFRVEWREYSAIKNDVEGKISDINRLLSQGGLLIVILDVLEVFKCHTGGYTGGTLYTATNYDFLDMHFFEAVRNGSGDRVNCDPANAFSKVIKGSSVLWTAFISGQGLPYPFSPSEVFATNGTNAFVGASTEVGAGHVVFLPNFKQLNEELFFEACTEYRYQREGTPPPDWTSSVYLPGVTATEEEIASVEETIRALKEERQQKLIGLDKRLAYKKLLFAKSNSVALVNSVELYAIVCGILDGNIKDLEPIREKILTTNGYIDLRRFIVKSPFVAK